MKKKITAMLLAICCISSTWTVYADDFSSGSSEVEIEITEDEDEDADDVEITEDADADDEMFSDGTESSTSGGDISAMANQIVARAEIQAQEYQQLKKEAKKYADAQEVARRAQEIKEETARIRKQALKEAARRKEEKRVANRQAVADFAVQFVGNPYVWGGTSLTEGADCSGFVQQIYKNFGYNLPRVAEDQSQYGTKIPVEDAQPGDLIFYAKDGYVHHVVMYAGDGKTIEAANEDQGIISGTVYIPEAVWATRILEENYNLEGTDVNEQNATAEQYGDSIGEYTIDYYCSCETCRAKASKVKATGTPVVEGQTIAVDPDEIPYGTKVIIDGHVFTAEDYDTSCKEKHISIYVNEHETAQKLNEKKAEVYLVK